MNDIDTASDLAHAIDAFIQRHAGRLTPGARYILRDAANLVNFYQKDSSR